MAFNMTLGVTPGPNPAQNHSKKQAVLLVNLGSPQSLAEKDIRRYLRQFLFDKYVIDLPWLFRWLLVYGIIVPFRYKKTRAMYQKIWQGISPLLKISQSVATKLQPLLQQKVYGAMRYQQPSIQSVLQQIQHDQVESLTVFLMYPHYALTTYQSAKEEVERQAQKLSLKSELRFVKPFFDHTNYIEAIAGSLRPHAQTAERILFSYHSIPLRHISKIKACSGNCFTPDCCVLAEGEVLAHCYRAQCLTTTRLTAQALKVEEKSITCFQSRFGKAKWLEPSLEEEIRHAKEDGVKKLVVLAPSFLTDCLETLEEIAQRGKEQFYDGASRREEKEFIYLPCLNDDDEWLSALSQTIVRHERQT